MSEQKENYMAKLDQWSEENVIQPIWDAAREFYTAENDEADHVGDEVFEDVRKAIREKNLESFRNGLRIGRDEANGEKRPKKPRQTASVRSQKRKEE